MKSLILAPFCLIGISVRTTNENGQAHTDIPALWNTFLSKNILSGIPNKVDDTIYCVYTDYEKDFTKPYTTLLGCQVSHLNDIPEGFVGKTFAGGTYEVVTATGKLNEGVVFQEWEKIWRSDRKRAYTADFEVYGAKSRNPDAAEVEILIALD